MSAQVFELRPPDSFPLCANTALHDAAAHEVEDTARFVCDAMRPLPAIGLILTGSLARGEGTVVADPNCGERWLSDIECLVVFDGGRWDRLRRALRDTEARRTNDPESRRRGIKLELRGIQAGGFAKLRPAIFSRELFEHGKLLWGELRSMRWPAWTAAPAPIPLIDGFRLLNNRIMEQVAARVADDESGGAEPVRTAYALSKFWIDLATSLSIFSRCYRTSYRDRQASIEEYLARRPGMLGGNSAGLLVARLRESMQVKLGLARPQLSSPSRSLGEAAKMGAQVWDWETLRLLGAGNGAASGATTLIPQSERTSRLQGINGHSADWRSVITRLRRLERMEQRLRDWARLLRPWRLRELGPRALWAAARSGSFANAIYGAGCILDFFWDEIGSGTRSGCEISDALGAMLNVGNGVPAPERRRQLAHRTVEAWERHLRFAAA